MHIRKIKTLIELLKKTGIAEIEIKEGEESVRISLNGTNSPFAFDSRNMAQAFNYALPQPQNLTSQSSATAEPIVAPLSSASEHILKSPMVGTFYASPSPGAKSFIEIGQKVKAGEILCIIEAMKMFNQIEADASGIIRKRLVENGQPVEFEQDLFVIELEEKG